MGGRFAGGAARQHPDLTASLTRGVVLTLLALDGVISAVLGAFFLPLRLGVVPFPVSAVLVGALQPQADEARARARQTQAKVHDLGRQMAEKDEREALAREVHDVLGHRLSLLSMQANALEIEAQEAGSRDVEDRARQIQEGAAGSMTDLRSLLAMLRTGATDESADHHELADIATLVTECIDAGTPVSSNVFVDQSHPLDPVISRSAYRITTELLTNARKHAPGSLVQLDIRGDARGGITISTTNPLPDVARAARSDGSGTGLTGVARRAQDVGGSFWAGPSPDGRRFTASATLPWTMPRV